MQLVPSFIFFFTRAPQSRRCHGHNVVWIRMTTLLRLGSLCRHGYNNKHAVKVRELSWYKTQRQLSVWNGKRAAVSRVWVWCFVDATMQNINATYCFFFFFHRVNTESKNNHWCGWKIITASLQYVRHNSETLSRKCFWFNSKFFTIFTNRRRKKAEGVKGQELHNNM